MRYKVGDCVLVRNDLIPNECCGDALFTSEMKNCLGRIVHIVCRHPCRIGYIITESSWCWCWTDEMFVCKIPPSDNMVIE